MRIGCFFLSLALMFSCVVKAQRQYQASSVLGSGSWYQLAVKEAGVYKVDLPMLRQLGVSNSSIPVSAIRLFGNGGAMLPEACNAIVPDDLVENAIEVIDDGDGFFNGSDYFLFYAPGPDRWIADTINQAFRHQKNLYTDRAFYYISIGGNGKRIALQTATPTANITVTSFSEHWFHELESSNLLNGSKDWLGEELSAAPGKAISLATAFTNPVETEPASMQAACVARSVNGSSRFTFSINNQSILQQDIASVGSSSQDLFARRSSATASITATAGAAITCTFTGNNSAQGWLDWLEVFYRRKLILGAGTQLLFRDWNSLTANGNARFSIEQAAGAEVWDVSEPAMPVKMNCITSGSSLDFTNISASLHEYCCFKQSFLLPILLGKLSKQDIHAAAPAGMLIICYPPFLAQARRIADFHQQQDQLSSLVLTTQQVFNEFSGGSPDPVAIRNCVKMFYDRAGADSSLRPKYLLLLGDASFDYKERLPNNTNFVPGYQNNASFDPVASYTSDDFFGMLDDSDDINAPNAANLLDIGIGRIPARSVDEASAFVDKLLQYKDPKSLGAWRNQLSFIADDQDANLHLNDAEAVSTAATATNARYQVNKFYLDAFKQEVSPFGKSYPMANRAINDQLQTGNLIWNYSGHGSYSRLAEEGVLDRDIANGLTNKYRLPLVITAACDFAPFDNPAIQSLGEDLLFQPNTGAIALMTTTRLVYSYSNRIMNRNYLQAALQLKPDGSYSSLGEAVRQAKNTTYRTQYDITNNRKFTLLGDPALTLSFPIYRVQTDSVNGVATSAVPDTLQPLQTCSIAGSISDTRGNIINGFNGQVLMTVQDAPQTNRTLGNDADSYPQDFQVGGNLLFKGKAQVINGRFSFSFLLPKDLHVNALAGRISYYADNGKEDANGMFNSFLVGGAPLPSSDNSGPAIKAYLNNENFVDGQTVPADPVLFLQLSDASGINIAGTGSGKGITVVIDGDASNTYLLNNMYEADSNTYQRGRLQWPVTGLEAGEHRLLITVWDANNNKTELTLHFRMLNKEKLAITKLFNYPNPFVNSTRFHVEYNRGDLRPELNIRIISLFGQELKTIRATINSNGSRSSDIDWDGRGNNGAMLPPGIYIYQLQLRSATDDQTSVKCGKLLRL